jgi:hypothetical protein
MGAVLEKHPPAIGDICSRFSFLAAGGFFFGEDVIDSAKTAIDSATAAESSTKVGLRADFLALPLMRWKMLMH